MNNKRSLSSWLMEFGFGITIVGLALFIFVVIAMVVVDYVTMAHQNTKRVEQTAIQTPAGNLTSSMHSPHASSPSAQTKSNQMRIPSDTPDPCSSWYSGSNCGWYADGHGMYCGQNPTCGIEGNASTLYTCQHNFATGQTQIVSSIHCANGCQIVSGTSDDYCK